MKFTLNWLKDHLDTSKNLDTIVETLTNIGLEIENVEDKSKSFNDFTADIIVFGISLSFKSRKIV